jgi:hypothetical protein
VKRIVDELKSVELTLDFRSGTAVWGIKGFKGQEVDEIGCMSKYHLPISTENDDTEI